MRIDKYKRVQKGIKFADYVKAKKGVCACGCGVALTGKQKKWASKGCFTKKWEEFQVLNGHSFYIRKALFERDNGYCRRCGALSDFWQADHIVPVHKGGGGCDLSNFQTLCEECHKNKTSKENKKRRQKKKKCERYHN